MKSAVIYARVSSREQEKEGFSIPAQIEYLKNYIDNLSEEVRKGLNEKVKEGYYPQKAPVGYKNVRVNGRAIIEVDNEKAPFIKKLFELYASGISAEQAREILSDEGFYNKNRPYTKSYIIRILHDCFYIGKFTYNGGCL